MSRAALSVVAVMLVIAAAFLIGRVIRSGGAPHAGTVPSTTPSGALVDVNPGTLLGQPVAAAAHLLREQGLSVRILWRQSDQQPPGTVLSVWPAGQRPAGSLVTLTGVLRHGQDGQQNGGGGDGNGKQKHHPGGNSGLG